jgi:hypothetical protein
MLRDLQRSFRRLVTGPDGSRAEAATADRLFVSRTQRSAIDRLAVYVEAYFWRLHDVIAEQHVALRKTLGAKAFEAMVRRYLQEHPPASHDIAEAGNRLAVFLASDAETCERPWLAELTRLEWLHLDLFVAADARPLAFDSLRAQDAESLASAVLRPVSAFALLECEYDVATLWRDPHRDAEPARRPTRLVVWRKQLEVFHRVVDAGEWAALQLVARGCLLAELGELLAEPESVDGAAERLGGLLVRWTEDQILAAE